MTTDDVRNVTFEQARKGYRVEDVDDFLLQVANEMERIEGERGRAMGERAPLAQQIQQLAAERDAAIAAKSEMENKLYVLAAKVEEYRGQEDTLKTALINAQRMGETVVYEAKQKAEQMLREATGQSEILRERAEQDAERERKILAGLVEEVHRFKSTILNLYKQHIESLSAIDTPVARAEKGMGTDAPAPLSPDYTERGDVNDELIGRAEPEIPARAAAPAAFAAGEEAQPALFEGELLED